MGTQIPVIVWMCVPSGDLGVVICESHTHTQKYIHLGHIFLFLRKISNIRSIIQKDLHTEVICHATKL